MGEFSPSFFFKWLRTYLQSFLKPLSVVCDLKGRCPVIGISFESDGGYCGEYGWIFHTRVSAYTHNKNNGKIMVQDRARMGREKEVGQLMLHHYIFVKGSEKPRNPAKLDLQLLLRVFFFLSD